MVAADGKLWVFGGRGGEMILFNDVYCFDPGAFPALRSLAVPWYISPAGLDVCRQAAVSLFRPGIHIPSQPSSLFSRLGFDFGLDCSQHHLWRPTSCAHGHGLPADTKSWTKPKTSGTAPQGRDFCSATLLPDGKSVLVFGGSRELGEDAEYFNDAHIFDTGSGAWSPLAAKGAPPSVRYSHAAALVGNKVFVFGGTEGSGDFLDLDDLHVLTVDGAPAGAKMPGAVKLPQAAPPRRKPSVPTPTSAAPQAAPPRRSASGDYVPTKKLDVDYAQPTPAPAARRKVAPKVLKEVAKRDYDEVQAGMVDSLERIFAKIKAEYSQIDNARQELNADREAFEKEKLANEQMHEQQQADLAAAVEKHKAETEAWLEKHVLENDRVRKELADVRAELGRDRAKLTREEEKLRLSNEQLAEEEANFQERSKKMDALMAQFKGI